MARPKRPEKVRLNLDLAPEVRVRLEELQMKTSADSLSEVVRRALAVYDVLVTYGGHAPKLMLEDGTVEKLVLF